MYPQSRLSISMNGGSKGRVSKWICLVVPLGSSNPYGFTLVCGPIMGSIAPQTISIVGSDQNSSHLISNSKRQRLWFQIVQSGLSCINYQKLNVKNFLFFKRSHRPSQVLGVNPSWCLYLDNVVHSHCNTCLWLSILSYKPLPFTNQI